MKKVGQSFMQRGFTIVELLIVIVIIGILAALVIVAYNGMQNRANDTAVQSDLNAFAKKLETIKVDSSDGLYPTTFTAAMGFKFTKNAYMVDSQGRTLRYCTNAATNEFIIYALSKSGTFFSYKTGAGLKQTYNAVGYSVCSQISLVTTNPTADGLVNSTWSSWVN